MNEVDISPKGVFTPLLFSLIKCVWFVFSLGVILLAQTQHIKTTYRRWSWFAPKIWSSSFVVGMQSDLDLTQLLSVLSKFELNGSSSQVCLEQFAY